MNPAIKARQVHRVLLVMSGPLAPPERRDRRARPEQQDHKVCKASLDRLAMMALWDPSAQSVLPAPKDHKVILVQPAPRD